MHARGSIIGILSIMSHKENRFDAEIVMMLKAIADIVGVAIDNARLHEKHVENERRLQAILHSTADGIIATDKHSRISLVNHAAAKMLHVKADELLGVPLREAAIEARVRDKLLLAVSTPGDDAFRVFIEPGQELSVLVSSVQTPGQVDNENAQDGWVIVFQDITHVREAEIARTQFIQYAAHDMKNPLSVAQSAIQTLTSLIDEPDATVQEVLGYARTGINRVQRLIDDLAQIEKIESGYGFHREDVDIREMCHEVSAQIMPLMMEKKLHYALKIENDVPYMFSVDREWMQRALFNYLENAAKYQYEGGQVILRVSMRDHRLHFEVEDDGPGIPRNALARVFDRFYRVDEQRGVRGSGLGLAIVKSVAEAHGGEAYVESFEGDGSTFGLTIPLEQENWLVPA
jgi:two-component system phosphate regulon sensor histidine kinase PhoR